MFHWLIAAMRLTDREIALITPTIVAVGAAVVAWVNTRAKVDHSSKLDSLAESLAQLKEDNAHDHQQVRDKLTAMRQDQSSMLSLLVEHIGDHSAHAAQSHDVIGTPTASGDAEHSLVSKEPRVGRSRRAS